MSILPLVCDLKSIIIIILKVNDSYLKKKEVNDSRLMFLNVAHILKILETLNTI